MSRDEDADSDGYSEQELPRPTARVRFMQGNHRTDRDDDVVSDTITLDLINAYRDRERRLTTQVRRLQSENDDFRTQLGEHSVRLEEEATVQSRKKDTTAEDLQKQLGEMRLELEARSTELREAQRHKDYLISQLAEKTTELQRVSVATPPPNALAFFASQLTEKSAEVAKARQEIERLQKASDQMQQENGTLLEMTERMRDEIASANKLIAEFERQKAAWQADRNTDRQADIDRLKAEAERNASALKQSVAERDQKIEGMQHELNQKCKFVDAKTAENEALNKKLESLQAELEHFKQDRNKYDIDRQMKERADREREKQNRDCLLAKENRALLERISAQEKEISSLKEHQRNPPEREHSSHPVSTSLSFPWPPRQRPVNWNSNRMCNSPRQQNDESLVTLSPWPYDNGGDDGTWTEVTRGKNKPGHQRDPLEREHSSHPVSTLSSLSTATPVIRNVPVKILPDPTPRQPNYLQKSPPSTGTANGRAKTDYATQLAEKQSKERDEKERNKQLRTGPSQFEVWSLVQKIREITPHISVLKAERIVAERLRSGPVDIELLVNELLQKDEDNRTQGEGYQRL